MAQPILQHEPTVLLVDTPHDDRAMYAEYLSAHGFIVIEIDNAATALSEATKADVIVTGIRIGPFDGIELVRRLRSTNRTRWKAIIVLTACAFELDRSQALAAGADVFLTKPCLPERLVTEIRAGRVRRVPRLGPARAVREPRDSRRAS